METPQTTETQTARQKPETLKHEQIGGSHYKSLVIEPAEYCQRNRFNCCESEAIIYLSRHHLKNGAEDIRKAIHFCKMILEFEYGETYESPDESKAEPNGLVVPDERRYLAGQGSLGIICPHCKKTLELNVEGEKTTAIVVRKH